MTILKKFAMLFLWVFVILPILEAQFYHGYGSYRQYYNNRINTAKYSMTGEISEQPNYNHDVEKGIKYSEDVILGNHNYTDFKSNFRISNNDGLQARNSYSDSMEKISVPKGCDDQFICENDSEYPQELVNRILSNNEQLLTYAFEDGANIDSRKDTKPMNYCPFRNHNHSPRQAMNIYNEWKWIMQSDEKNFHQRIYYEICESENSSCDEIDRHLSGGYVSKCVQGYVKRKLLALNGTEPSNQYFSLKMKCCCDIEKRER